MARSMPLAPTRFRPARGAHPPDAGTRLALAEFLVACEDPVHCAQRSLEWLGEHAGVKRSLCAVIDPDLTRVAGLAAYGIPSLQVQFSVDLEARDHPLILALHQKRPVFFPHNGKHPATELASVLGEYAFVAVPLHGRVGQEEFPVGWILAHPVSDEITREAAWLGQLLGHRLARLRWHRRLKRENDALHAILNAVPDPILLTDPEGRIVIANSRAEVLFANKEGESEGRARAVAINNMLFSSALGQRAIAGAEPARREVPLVDPTEGSDLLVELLSSLAEAPREGTGIVSILRDVTDLRRATMEIEENYRRLGTAEAEVRAERDRLNLIINSVWDPILVTDPAGSIVLMNVPAERLFTLAPGASGEEAQRVQANDAHFSSFAANPFFSSADQPYSGVIGLINPQTGAGIPMEAVSGKILSGHGELMGIVTILHDRTEALEKEALYEELKRARDQLEEKVSEATAELARQNELLRRQAIQLEQASALKSQFLANMSHEFRTPLNAILGYTSLLDKGVAGSLTPNQRQNLSRVESNARHLMGIINDILDISRIEAGRMPLRLGDVQLPKLIAEVMGEVEPLIRRSRLAVKTDLASDLPLVRSDHQKVKQILLNLLFNAIKFTPQGSVTVSATSLPAAQQVAIAVTDTGIGVAEEDREKIFEDFRQADDSPTRVYGGAGLGLAISRRLAHMLGGQITLQSRRGEGSTFTLLLPCRMRRR